MGSAATCMSNVIDARVPASLLGEHTALRSSQTKKLLPLGRRGGEGGGSGGGVGGDTRRGAVRRRRPVRADAHGAKTLQRLRRAENRRQRRPGRGGAEARATAAQQQQPPPTSSPLASSMLHQWRARGDAAAATPATAAAYSLLFLAATLASALGAATGPRQPLDVFQHHHGAGRHPTRDVDVPDLEDPLAAATHANEGAAPHRAVSGGQPTVLYQVGTREEDLPECAPWAVCSKVDLYEAPWVERQCRCPGRQACSSLLSAADGHTLTDRTRHLKLCEPIKKLPKCRFFRDVTWTLVSAPNNVTEQVVRCHCPKGAVAYLIKRSPYTAASGAQGFVYSFACSPQSRLRCQRKEPCRLFTVRKRPELLDEVNTNTLCQCPHGHTCPRHHTEPGVIPGSSYADEEPIRTFSGYCLSPAIVAAAEAAAAAMAAAAATGTGSAAAAPVSVAATGTH